MTNEKKPVWKTDAAREAFVELTKAAGMMREQQLSENEQGMDRTRYEKFVLKTTIYESYHRQLAVAYSTAAQIEVQALSLQASITAAFSEGH